MLTDRTTGQESRHVKRQKPSTKVPKNRELILHEELRNDCITIPVWLPRK